MYEYDYITSKDRNTKKDPTYWKTALLSSSNPKKVNGAINTNINNKNIKLVLYKINECRHIFCMQAECVKKEASGEEIEGKT